MLFVVRALVRCYPPAFRAQYAREVEESARVVLQSAWQRGLLSGLAMTMRVIGDLLQSVLTERQLARLRADGPRRRRFGMGAFGQDVRDAIRQLHRNPTSAAAAILTLALALGGVTAVFAIADPLLFRPLPYAEGDRIVRLTARTANGSVWLYAADFLALLDGRSSFEAIGEGDRELHIGRLRDEDPPDAYVAVNGVGPEFLRVLGVTPLIGRTFRAEEHQGARVALITHHLWKSHYNGRPDIVGQTLSLRSSRPVTFEIVGVLPASFVFPDFDGDRPVAVVPSDVDRRMASTNRYMSMPLGLLKPGVSLEAAQAELAAAMAAVEASGPQFRAYRRSPEVKPLAEVMFAAARRPMTLLLSVTAFVALLAALNLAHLFLARSASRARELATRTALGASRTRIVRMLLVEASAIALLGWAAALIAGRLFRDAVLAMLPETAYLYRAVPSALDGRVALVTGLCALASLCVFGLLPAIRGSRTDLRSAIAEGQAGRGAFARAALVFAQTGAAVAVLLTALLLAFSYARLANQSLGFTPEGVMSASLRPSTKLPDDPGRLRQLNFAMKDRVQALTGGPVALAGGMPGVTLPMGLGRLDQESNRYRIIGYPVSAEFFDVMQIRVVRGRLPSPQEGLSGAPLAVLDERAARFLWPGLDPLGQQVRDTSGHVRTVIGIVAALQTHLFSPAFQRPTAFVPLPEQHGRLFEVLWRGERSESIARTLMHDAGALLPKATAFAAPLDIFGRELGQPRFLATLLGALGALAVALTVVGLYGVVSHAVAQRTREMGIRIALGAETLRIARMIVAQTLKPAALGVALGLALSLWWTETLRTMLYGFSPHDWRVFLAAGAAVLLLVALACVLPVRRATRVDPLIALRTE